MFSEESVKEQQENELAALQAIYMEDLKDLRGKGVWNKWIPLDISVTLTPSRGSSGLEQVHAKVDLHIICSENYPHNVPIIKLENPSGMSDNVLYKLECQLQSKAVGLTGEVMIFQLCEYVKDFLHKHNKPATRSFYEEMVSREEQKKQQEQTAKQIIQDRENQKFINEVHEREKILLMENIRRKQARINSENSNDSDNGNRSSLRYSLNDEMEALSCGHLNTSIIEFSNNGWKRISRGRCITHSKRNCVLYSGLDQENGQLYLISEWKVNINSEKQIASLIQELNYLVKLKDINLTHYLNICSENLPEENKTVLYVLQEFVFGLNCTQLYLSENIAAEINMIRHIAEGVLNALDFLHRNNVVHKDLTDSCVYINRKGRIKVSNYSLDKRLTDLVSQTQCSNYKKKNDIHKFGLLILSLIKGCFIEEDNIEIPTNIPSDLHDFLSNCLSSNERNRYTAVQLLNHSFLKVPLLRTSPLKNGVIKEPERIESPEERADLNMIAHKASGGQSRVDKEFEILNHLGKGAYGDVYKVKNILDQRNYALKRIELNPRNRQINKKIIREVKLLSRLNHENVVRYYNSWIETAIVNNDIEKDSTDSSFVTPSATKLPVKEVGFVIDDSDIERLAPPMRDVEWSISYGRKPKTIKDDSSSDDSDDTSDDDDDNWDLQENYEFEIEYDGPTVAKIDNGVDSTDSAALQMPKEIQFMYIQMEFCEKSTLSTAIDDDLYKDKDRVWRLFREIVEGLAHIHQQDMIHRDLKPMNIFLDLNDHVKIGDFGLATTNLLYKPNDPMTMSKSYYDNDGSHETVGDPSMTGYIGTALYVAPELTLTTKAVYNKKVDIYSLGIIFFEMSYNPLKTTMERINVISRLRSEKTVLPSDFLEKASSDQEKIIRWLLNQNASQRPSSQELLESEYIPPPVIEERELRELVRHTLSNPQLKAYKYLVESCFKQPVTAAQDITYDRDVSASNTIKNIQMYNHIKESIIKVFKLHGGQNLSAPLLMPKSKYYNSIDTCVNLMTHSGSVVSIPHDLRVPFARYVAWNGITCLRRYSIERVYREKRVFGFIPRELHECAFDIVTSTPDSMADAEILYILKEVIEEVPSFKNRNLLIRLNHTLLLKAILMHCGVKDKQDDLYSILSEAKEGKVTKLQVRTHLISSGLSDNCISTLFTLLELEGNMHKIASALQTITKRKNSEAAGYAKQGLQELKLIIQNAEAFEIPFNIVVTLGLVYNVQQYSGMMCQLVCEVRRKQKLGMDVLAAGGRYDNMISSYRNMMIQANILNKDIKQSAVGISISLDKLISAMQKGQRTDNKLVDLDAAVCSMGNNILFKEKSKVLKDLWSAGLRCCVIEAATLEDVQEQLNVPCVVILKDTEVKIRLWDWERDRFQEKKIGINEVVETVQRIIKCGSETCSEQSSFSNSLLMRSESKTSHVPTENQDCNVNIYFLSTEKISANIKKRQESQIRSQLNSVFKRLNGEVCLLVINLENSVITTMATRLEFESEYEFQKSVESVKEKHPRHKKYLIQICDKIFEEINKRTKPVIILYSQIDNIYKVLL